LEQNFEPVTLSCYKGLYLWVGLFDVSYCGKDVCKVNNIFLVFELTCFVPGRECLLQRTLCGRKNCQATYLHHIYCATSTRSTQTWPGGKLARHRDIAICIHKTQDFSRCPPPYFTFAILQQRFLSFIMP
jgi:hypothetical protein